MRKVTDLDSARKPCQYCNATPACPGYTCKRIASVTWELDGAVTLTFMTTVEVSFTQNPPPTGDTEDGD